MGHLNLNPEPCLINYCDDPGILRKTGNTGKRGSKNPQKTIPHSCRETPARYTGTGIPCTRSLLRDRTCPAHRQVLPAHQRPFPGLLHSIRFFPINGNRRFYGQLRLFPKFVSSRSPAVQVHITCPSNDTAERPHRSPIKNGGLSPMKRA